MKHPLDSGEYAAYDTLYRVGDGWYELSNDGTVYVAKLPIVKFIPGTGGTLIGETAQQVCDYSEVVAPEVKANENYEFTRWSPEIPQEGAISKDTTHVAVFSYVPTLAELKILKIDEVNSTKNLIVTQGFDAKLSGGTVEHFSLDIQDQLYLTALQTQVLAGVDPIPWHMSDENIPCKYYSNADMSIITQTAMSILVYHVTYLKDLTRYINSIQTKEELKDVQYGMILPIEYQSEPLQNMMAQINE